MYGQVFLITEEHPKAHKQNLSPWKIPWLLPYFELGAYFRDEEIQILR